MLLRYLKSHALPFSLFCYLYRHFKQNLLADAEIYKDAQLISRLAKGDTDAFNMVYDQFCQRLFQFARRFVDHEAEAEDIASEAFVKLWSRREELPAIGSIAGFLHTVVKNRCMDYLRHEQVKLNKKQDLVVLLQNIPQADFSHEMLMIELMKKIYNEVDKLPPKMRDIFYLSYKEGLKPAHIAEKLNLSVQTVKNQRANAIKLLRKSFSDNPLLMLAFIYITSK